MLGRSMQIPLLALVCVAVVAGLGESAYACSCEYRKTSGFERAPDQVLPSNAKGVLFKWRYMDFSGDYPSLTNNPIGAKDLSFRDLTSGAPVKYKIVKIVFEIAKPKEDQSEENKYPDTNLNPAEKNDGLFRIEPIGGFKPGHKYKVSYVGPGKMEILKKYLSIEVADTPFDVNDFEKVQFERDGVATLKELPVVTRSGSCSTGTNSVVQKMKFVYPKSLDPYHKSLDQQMRISESDDRFRAWAYSGGLCSGDSQNLIYKYCSMHKEYNSGAPELVYVEKVYGAWAFLEVDSLYRSSKVIRPDLKCPPQTIEENKK